MSAPGPTIADIDDAIAKAEWWLRLLEELAESGVVMTTELAAAVKAGSLSVHVVADDYATIAAAVRQAIALSMQLEEALRGLNALRNAPSTRSPPPRPRLSPRRKSTPPPAKRPAPPPRPAAKPVRNRSANW